MTFLSAFKSKKFFSHAILVHPVNILHVPNSGDKSNIFLEPKPIVTLQTEEYISDTEETLISITVYLLYQPFLIEAHTHTFI